VSRALARAWGPQDVVVVTELDHHANIDPWRAIAQDRGVQIESVRLDPGSGELDEAALERALQRSPRLVAITAASNALGTMPDVARIAARARSAGALVFVDAVHYAPHALIDVAAMQCDFLACSAYKFYGPHIGILWGKHALLESIDVPRVAPAHSNAPDRVETGTLNHEGIAGAGAVVDFLAGFGTGNSRRERLRASYATIHQRATRIFAQLWDGLGSIDGVTRFGPSLDRPRSPTVSFAVRGLTPRDVAVRLAERGVFVSHGDFYAATVAKRLAQPDGFVRAGLSGYSTPEEVSRLVEGVRQIAAGR
jgi:cysteine desulfurase family protein (TIGR01976 family)